MKLHLHPTQFKYYDISYIDYSMVCSSKQTKKLRAVTLALQRWSQCNSCMNHSIMVSNIQLNFPENLFTVYLIMENLWSFYSVIRGKNLCITEVILMKRCIYYQKMVIIISCSLLQKFGSLVNLGMITHALLSWLNAVTHICFKFHEILVMGYLVTALVSSLSWPELVKLTILN